MKILCPAQAGINVGGQFYPAVDGVVEVPEPQSQLALIAGYLPASEPSIEIVKPRSKAS